MATKLYNTQTVTIANGEAESTVFDVYGLSNLAVETPASMTGTSFTFKVSTSKTGTFTALYKSDGNLETMTISSSRITKVPTSAFGPYRYAKLVSSSNETGAKTITIQGSN